MMESDSTGWRSQLHDLTTRGQIDSALTLLQTEAAKHPDDSELQIELAKHLAAANEQHEALAVLSALSGSNDFYARFRGMLESADIKKSMGDMIGAETMLRCAHAADPGSHWPILRLAELLAHTGRVNERLPLIEATYHALRPDGRAEIARHVAEFTAYDHFNQTRHRPDWHYNDPIHVPELARAGIIMLVKDEDDIIWHNLNHHYAMGFRAFCILNNRSADQTRHRIDDFRTAHPDCFMLVVDDPVAGHYQGRKMKIFGAAFIEHAQLAEIEIDWLFYLDADEFIATGTVEQSNQAAAALGAILNDPETRLIIMHWVHAAATQVTETLPPERSPFEVMPNIQTQLMPVVPKIAVRTHCSLQPVEGNHFVQTFDYSLRSARTLATAGWYLFHFSLRSISHVRKKVINGGRAFQGTKGLETHGGHWRERYALYEKHGETVLQQILSNHITAISREIKLLEISKSINSDKINSQTYEELSLDDASKTLSGVERIKISESYFAERPEPAFVYGAITNELKAEFTRENAVWPVSVFMIKNAEIFGPWFEIGSLIMRDRYSFSCQEIYQSGRGTKQDAKLSECLHEIKTGRRSYLDISENCVLLATNGHAIYGHWLIDFLPKIYLLEQIGISLNNVKYLVPSDVGDWAEHLLQLMGIEKSNIIRYDQNRTTPRCRRLIVPTLLRMSGRMSPLLKNAVDFINKLIAPCLQTNIAETSKQLYLARDQSDAWRRIRNNDQVEAVLKGRGYTVMRMEKLAVRDQILVMRGANKIIGQHGSALHGTIFCDHPIESCVLHENVTGWFAGLQAGIAERIDQSIGYVFGETNEEKNKFTTNFSVIDIERACL